MKYLLPIFLRILFVFNLGVLTSACIGSEKKLLSDSDGLKLFGQQFFYFGNQADGIKVKKAGEIDVASFYYENGAYRDKDSSVSLSFHKINGVDEFYLSQLYMDSLPVKITYFLTRKSENRYGMSFVLINESVSQKASNIGIEIEEISEDKPYYHVFSNAGDLRKLFSLISADLNDVLQIPVIIATNAAERDKLVQTALELACLERAAHPYDRSLPSEISKGIPLNDIVAEEALPICKKAQTNTESDSVSYATARVYFASKNYAAATELLSQLKRRGFPLAFVLEGQMLRSGEGAKKDPQKARDVMESSPVDHPVLDYALGSLLISGELGYKDPVGAFKSFKRSAESEHRYAILELASSYENGMGTPKDSKQALALYQKASDLGLPEGALNVGRMLYEGKSVEKNHTRSHAAYRIAAKAGIADAQYSLGFMLAHGQGTAKNETAATDWLRKAAKQGNIPAKGELGRMIYWGLGTRASKKEGEWLVRESVESGGGANAKRYLEEIENDQTAASGNVSKVAPSAGNIEMCQTLESEKIRLTGDMADIVREYPGTNIVIGLCGAAALASQKQSGETLATFGICAAFGCGIAGFDNCSNVAMRWAGTAIQAAQIDNRKKTLSCP